MPIEIIGAFSHRPSADDNPAPLSDFDSAFLTSLVKAYDRNGYDRMLIANGAIWPDSLPFAAYIAGVTQHVGSMIAHRPGFIAPTMAARMLAVVDRLGPGRSAVHIITGANDAEMESDGDFLTKDVRYERSAEYVEVMRKMWSSPEPFDHDGRFYKFRRAFCEVKPVGGKMPVFWGGVSEQAIDTAGRCADVYALGVDTLEQTEALIGRAKAHAAAYGRELGFCLSTRIIVGETEADAWATAARILQGVCKVADRIIRTSMNNLNRKAAAPLGPRLQQMLAQGPVLDERLWIEITRATRGARHGTSLVGTAEQVAYALMKYHDLGVRRFLLQGFDFNSDPDVFGRGLIPMLRVRAAERERQGGL